MSKFTKEGARLIGLSAAERLFLNGKIGDAVFLMKGDGGRILTRDYLRGDHNNHDPDACWLVTLDIDGEVAVWNRAPKLEGMSTSEMITFLSVGEHPLRTIIGPGGEVTFRGVRSPDGAEWFQSTGWRAFKKNGQAV